MKKKVLNKIAEEEFVIQFVSDAREHVPCLGEKKLWHMYRKHFLEILITLLHDME